MDTLKTMVELALFWLRSFCKYLLYVLVRKYYCLIQSLNDGLAVPLEPERLWLVDLHDARLPPRTFTTYDYDNNERFDVSEEIEIAGKFFCILYLHCKLSISYFNCIIYVFNLP